MRKILFLILPLVFATILNAQENSFLLYSFKGDVAVVENKVESKARVGKIMTNASSIKLAKGAMATIICNEAAMFSLSKTGTFTLNSFKDSCHVGNNSLSANYVKYVWSQMTEKSEGAPGSNRKAFMSTVGAVSRSVNNIWIDPRLDTINYVSGEFPLSWKSYSDAKEFEFSLFKAADGSPAFYKNSIKKLKMKIPDILTQIKPGNSYYWTAAVKGEENDELKVLNYVTKETFDAVLARIKASGAFESEAEQAYRIAFMLEDAHYLGEAHTYYMKAAQLNPELPLYRSTLMSFRKDYDIK